MPGIGTRGLSIGPHRGRSTTTAEFPAPTGTHKPLPSVSHSSASASSSASTRSSASGNLPARASSHASCFTGAISASNRAASSARCWRRSSRSVISGDGCGGRSSGHSPPAGTGVSEKGHMASPGSGPAAIPSSTGTVVAGAMAVVGLVGAVATWLAGGPRRYHHSKLPTVTTTSPTVARTTTTPKVNFLPMMSLRGMTAEAGSGYPCHSEVLSDPVSSAAESLYPMLSFIGQIVQ